MTDRASEKLEEIPLRNLFQVLFRHKGKGAAVFAAVFLGVSVLGLMAPASYRSQAKLLIKIGRESVTLDPTVTTGPTVDVRQSRVQELNSELAILKSEDVVRAAVRATGALRILEGTDPAMPGDGGGPSSSTPGTWLQAGGRWAKDAVSSTKDVVKGLLGLAADDELLPEDQAVLVVEEGLDIKLVPDSNVISVSYDAPAPGLAHDVVESVVATFLDRHLEVHETPGSYRFFQTQAEAVASDLARTESSLRDLKNRLGISNVASARQSLLDRLARVEMDLSTARTAESSTRARRDELERILSTLDETVLVEESSALSNPFKDALQSRLSELRIEEKALQQTFRPDSRRMKALRDQIAIAEELLAQENPESTTVTRGANPTRQAIEVALLREAADLASHAGELDLLLEEKSNLEGELRDLISNELEITRLERQIQTHESNFLRYSENLERARIDQALQAEKFSNVSILQPARMPLESDGPRRSILLLGALVLGLIGGISTAFTADLLDQSLRTADDVRDRTGLSTLASVPKRGRLKRLQAAPAPELEDLCDHFLGKDQDGTGHPRILGVCAAHRGEGVSTIAAHLAVSLSERGEDEVLLVDASLEHPSLHRVFRQPQSPGLVEALRNETLESARETWFPSLQLLTAGSRNGSDDDRWVGTRFRDRLSRWGEAYRYVVLDLPPINERTRAANLAALCDSVVLVVQAENHRWQVAEHARSKLERAGAHLEGVVLNKRRYHIPGAIYRRI